MLDQPKLLIDVGNTELKYAWFKHTDRIEHITCQTIKLSQLDELIADCPEVFICSVKSTEVTSKILSKFEQIGLHYDCVETKAEEFGIKNSYEQVSNMGCDRWMAMMGASALVKSDFLVIDAGTAITCDFVVNDEHLGGWIAPGLSMLRSSVVQNTQRVFDFEGLEPQLRPGTDTANCVANGALAQIVGMVMQAIKLMESRSKGFSVVLTGGDHNAIRNVLNNYGVDTLSHVNLVLAGLARISQRNIK